MDVISYRMGAELLGIVVVIKECGVSFVTDKNHHSKIPLVTTSVTFVCLFYLSAEEGD